MLNNPPAILAVDTISQLKLLSPEEITAYIKNHLHSFLLTSASCNAFLRYFESNDSGEPTPEKQKLTLYFMNKMLQFSPCSTYLVARSLILAPDPQLEERLTLLNAMSHHEEGFNKHLQYAQTSRRALSDMKIYLESQPNYLPGAHEAIKYSYSLGHYVGRWVEQVDPDPPLRTAALSMIFNHFASQGEMDYARPYWDRLDTSEVGEVTLNMAAEMFAANGDSERALGLYTKSLEMDPLQGPVKFRIRELRNPFIPDDSLLSKRKVNICLQTCNNSEQLKQTLSSLAQSDIGPARINILINGCSDDSFFVADNARSLFPENRVTIHTLHTYIGGPAGRNWLLGLPEIQQSDYVAFLEDNVTVPRNWLACYLTVAEQDERIAVVGCKVLSPEHPRFCSHLYRYATMARDNFFKMSIAAPETLYDYGCYNYIRETRTVSNALHLLRTRSLLQDAPAGFDTRFSYSSVSNIDHDIMLGLSRNKIMFCGHVTCLHDQTQTNPSTIYGETPYGNNEANRAQLSSKHAYNTGWLQGFDSLRHDIQITQEET